MTTHLIIAIGVPGAGVCKHVKYKKPQFIGLSTGYWFALSTIQDRKTIDNLENIT